MKKYELRCCCDAGLLLGILTVPTELHNRQILTYKIEGQQINLQASYIYAGGMSNILMGGDQKPKGVAIKSNNYPIETLEKIPGFEKVDKQIAFPSSEELRHEPKPKAQ